MPIQADYSRGSLAEMFSQYEVADMLGCQRSSVQQSELTAIRKLRWPPEMRRGRNTTRRKRKWGKGE